MRIEDTRFTCWKCGSQESVTAGSPPVDVGFGNRRRCKQCWDQSWN